MKNIIISVMISLCMLLPIRFLLSESLALALAFTFIAGVLYYSLIFKLFLASKERINFNKSA